MTVKELTNLAQHTLELHHEVCALQKLEQDYKQKLEEADLDLPKKGDSLKILQSELKQQRKLARSLKKKSLWSKTLEEVMEKIVDTVTYVHKLMFDAFGNYGVRLAKGGQGKSRRRLGPASLALHYANVINQINNIASYLDPVPPNTRDNLYQGLPLFVKENLRSRIQMLHDNEERTIVHLKAEIDKTLHWLVPIAINTTKAYQGFGWIGEWATTRNELGKKPTTQNNPIRLLTLYHYNKQKVDMYILEIVALLHCLIDSVQLGLNSVTFRSTRKGRVFDTKMLKLLSFSHGSKDFGVRLSQDDRDLSRKLLLQPDVLDIMDGLHSIQ